MKLTYKQENRPHLDLTKLTYFYLLTRFFAIHQSVILISETYGKQKEDPGKSKVKPSRLISSPSYSYAYCIDYFDFIFEQATS